MGLAMFVLPQRTTKFILGLICWLNIIWSLETIVQCSLQIFPMVMEEMEDELQLSHILSTIESMLNPLYASIQKLYVVYSIHRYAVITNKASVFTKPIWLIFFLVFTLLLVCATESLHILDDFFYADRRFKNLFKVIWSSYLVIKLSLDAIFTSVHLFVLRSITKTLTESDVFLRSLNPTENIKKRLIAISGILKFNRVLLFLQLSVPLFEIIKLLSFVVRIGFCSRCNSSKLSVAYFVLDGVKNMLGAFQSTVFAFIHLRFMTVFSCKRENNATVP